MSGSHSTQTKHLFLAIQSKDLTKLEAVVESLGDERNTVLNSQGSEGKMPLVSAASYRQPKMVEYLFRQGANPAQISANIRDFFEFFYCCLPFYYDLLKEMLGLLEATHVSTLISTKLHSSTPLAYTIGKFYAQTMANYQFGHTESRVKRKIALQELFDYLLSFNPIIEDSALRAAIMSRHIYFVQQLLKNFSKRKVNELCTAFSSDHMPLQYYAAQLAISEPFRLMMNDDKSFDIFMYLLQAGANLESADYTTRPYRRENAIHLILRSQDITYIRKLTNFIASSSTRRAAIANLKDLEGNYLSHYAVTFEALIELIKIDVPVQMTSFAEPGSGISITRFRWLAELIKMGINFTIAGGPTRAIEKQALELNFEEIAVFIRNTRRLKSKIQLIDLFRTAAINNCNYGPIKRPEQKTHERASKRAALTNEKRRDTLVAVFADPRLSRLREEARDNQKIQEIVSSYGREVIEFSVEY